VIACLDRLFVCNLVGFRCPDLREHRAYLDNHSWIGKSFRHTTRYYQEEVTLRNLFMQGEELRKQIGAAAYIECSSRTQQVLM
jgi:hypothetical protein